MGVLASAEHYGNLYFIPILKKLVSRARLGVEIVFAYFGAQPDFSQKRNLLALAGFTLFLGLGVLEFTVVHKAAHRRYGRGSHLHQIEPGFFSHLSGLIQGHYTQLLALFTDEANFPAPYHLVNA